MATYVPAKRATEYIFYVSLVSQANTKVMQSTPTIAAGDFKVSKDGGALANLTTLPAVTPAASKMVKITLSSTEMTADNVTVVCSDASGAEWCDLTINIQTAARQIDDLAYPATSGRSMVVDAAGLVDANVVKVGPTGSGTAQTAGDIIGDTNDIQTRLPAALVSGRMDSSVGAIAAGVDLSSTMKTSVNTEVLDVLNTDTFAEPGQEAPPATTTLVKKLGYLYKFLRNRKTQTATTLSIYADNATTVDQKATISDNGTTYDHGEIATGP